jgi:hypothetical protein
MEPLHQNTNVNLSAVPPKTWLIESILATLLCCLPLEIVGIINASSVEAKFAKGDVEGAGKAAKLAKLMVLISVASGLIGFIVYVFYLGGLALFSSIN